MKQYIKYNPWKIIEKGFTPSYNQISESIFSLGNGKGGQRANFEENYSGQTLQGSYVAGVYYPDKTRVGWWKNGYPEYFAKVLNAPTWIGIKTKIEGKELDLNQCKVIDFERILDMKQGFLQRNFIAEFDDGKQIKVQSTRFMSLKRDEIGAIRYSITPLNFSASGEFILDIDADIANQDSNYDEKFWIEIEKSTSTDFTFITTATKKTHFQVCTAMDYSILQAGKTHILSSLQKIETEKYVAHKFNLELKENIETVIYKYAAITSSMYEAVENLSKMASALLDEAKHDGFEKLLEEQRLEWAKKWKESDIVIEGDVAAQQGIRYNIFQLNQTYSGKDERLNIGPKGFTGEKYGGSTYWDTEAFCLPFYLSTADQKIARNLLVYRHNHLQKAIENAQKLGFNQGAALYPMVTMDGDECHNEWEITFEEIHRNGAIAYAIYNYVKYTADKKYLATHGLEVLIAISRFWAQRVNFSEEKQQYVMLGVTGPNEYENNINNNWYTNTLAKWTLQYTMEATDYVKNNHPEAFQSITKKTNFDKANEFAKWSEIAKNMYFPENTEKGIFLQQDGFLDKEQLTVADLQASDRPLNQNWSWDRILRSIFIKQADVLQGLYFFEEDYDIKTIRQNYEYYEARTVHESSLSSCVHSILAAKLNKQKEAYEFYLNAARLDLDDYNNDTEDGLHITSMGGTWMNIVQGFGGMRIKENHLSFQPFIPEEWEKYSFQIRYRENLLLIDVRKNNVKISNQSGKSVTIEIFNQKYKLDAFKAIVVEMQPIEILA